MRFFDSPALLYITYKTTILAIQMQLFYTPDISLPEYTLPEEESAHCMKVLRLRTGDELHLTDGCGNLYRATVLQPDPKHCRVRITETLPRIRQTQLRSDGGRRADQEYRPLRMVSGKGDRNGHRPYHPHRMPPQRTPDAQTRTGRTGSDKCRQAVPEGLPSTAGRTDARRGSDRHAF